ncbi:hypothetical protein F4781DRAFT_432396 [Annulohypoxylon bovei var. microspora]|nr:hypothetical protein F4781DRAFT_432396 [Annulohypoxylon bovei var. microspora]
MSTPETPFPDLPNIGIKFPHSPITIAALAYTKQHTTEATYNHCIRAAYWALILAKKLPAFSQPSPERPLNIETVVLAAVLHDMGWATTKALVSPDKRFEVDGANLAYAFAGRYAGEGAEAWAGSENEMRRRTVWDAIALHCTASLALHHPAPEVALAHLGITADFLGPRFPPGDGSVLSEDEYRAVVARFPMAGFGVEVLKGVMCGLCRVKPETTYDNFVGAFGVRFGVVGWGTGGEEFASEIERREPVGMLLGGLGYLEGLLKGE